MRKQTTITTQRKFDMRATPIALSLADNRCVGARDEHKCRLLLRDDGHIPGGIWSWKVYVDGNIRNRGPGSTRKEPLKWYDTLLNGNHRVVIRQWDHTALNRIESNTLQLLIENQHEVIVDVAFVDGRIILTLAE